MPTKWIDNRRDGKLVSSELRLELFRVVVHRWSGGDIKQWYLTTYPGVAEPVRLTALDLDDAKTEAVTMIRERAEKTLEQLP